MTASKRKASKTSLWELNLGATYLGDGKVSFRVWAPRQKDVRVKILCPPEAKILQMKSEAGGFFACEATNVKPGTKYFYTLNGNTDRPDPVSRFQPEGVHGPSQVVDLRAFEWGDKKWKGISLSNLVLYELHVGTFTQEGTLDAVIRKIPYLKDLGVTAVEIMPLAQFPGERNWGYDGVDMFAVQSSYGDAEAFKRLVTACHEQGLGVCLDVVYNHLGPEGNYLHDFGPYFTNKYQTPWGDAINYDGADAKEVREFFISNALYWITEFHVDVLRLDAVHGIFDSSKTNVLEELNARVKAQAKALGREVILIAESDMNDPVLIRSAEEGGYALDAQWSDDFHHSAHVVLTGEQRGYYRDYSNLEDIAKAVKSGFIYDGKYSSFRQTEYGKTTEGIPGERFVINIQNHDQVGNRAFGDRMSTQISFHAQKIAATLLLTTPATPLIFMGQEYGETNPFQYFVDHGDPNLVKAVQKGRKAECASFGWHHAPDPKAIDAFRASKLNWSLLNKKEHQYLLALYQDLIHLRREVPELSSLNRKDLRVYVNEGKRWLAIEYPFGVPGAGVGIIISFLKQRSKIALPFQNCKKFEILLDTEHKSYGGLNTDTQKTTTGTVHLNPEHAVVGKIL